MVVSSSSSIFGSTQGAILEPRHEVVIADTLRRQIMGQHPPGAASAHDIEDGVEHGAFLIARRTAKLLRPEQQRFHQFPSREDRVIYNSRFTDSTQLTCEELASRFRPIFERIAKDAVRREQPRER